MAQIALIAPPTFRAITTGGGKQQQHELSYARKRLSLATVVPSRKMKKVPLFVSSSCGGERSRSVVVKVSGGGTISLPHGWPPQKECLYANRRNQNTASGKRIP